MIAPSLRRKAGLAAFAERYAASLRAQLGAKGPRNGDCAQGLGRTAIALGLQSRDVARIALVQLAPTHDFLNLRTAVRMEIKDNGKAFRVAKTLLSTHNKRLGLIGMKERLEMVGGELTITSVPGQGTTVRAQLPFKREKNKS